MPISPDDRRALVIADQLEVGTAATKTLGLVLNCEEIESWPQEGVPLESLDQFLQAGRTVFLCAGALSTEQPGVFVHCGRLAWRNVNFKDSQDAWRTWLQFFAPNWIVHGTKLRLFQIGTPSKVPVLRLLVPLFHDLKDLTKPTDRHIRHAVYQSLLARMNQCLFAPLMRCCDPEFSLRWRQEAELRQACSALHAALYDERSSAEPPSELEVMEMRLCRGYYFFFARTSLQGLEEAAVNLSPFLSPWLTL